MNITPTSRDGTPTFDTVTKQRFAEKYGPWAVITGASDGTGAAFAHQLAARGLNLVLIARREGLLSKIAGEVERLHGIQTRISTIDLYEPDAGQRVFMAAANLEVGLYVSNAGADPNGARFLDAPIERWVEMVNRNVTAVVTAAYGFSQNMRSRGRGGLIFMSSGAALGGGPGLAVYSATKGFDLNFAESLWIELKPFGIDVISGVCPAMDTPSLELLLARNNLTVPGLYRPDDVVGKLLDCLPDGPIHIFPFGSDTPPAAETEKARRARIGMMIEAEKLFMGK